LSHNQQQNTGKNRQKTKTPKKNRHPTSQQAKNNATHSKLKKPSTKAIKPQEEQK